MASKRPFADRPKIKRRHWAALRAPDIVHNGRKIWRAPHDSQRGVLTSFWYSEAGGDAGPGQDFDVRHLPGYTEFPVTTARPCEFRAQLLAEQEHHARIIRQCIDAGIDMMAVHRAEQQRKDAGRAMRPRMTAAELDMEVPF